MLLRVLVAAALAVGLGGAVLTAPTHTYEARVETRASHIAALQAASNTALAAQPPAVLHHAAESCDVMPKPVPAPTQARGPAAPARQDI